MLRFSIARSVQIALLGLTVVLVALAGVGIANLYSARQRYEDRIGAAFALEADAANLLAGSVVEEATIRTAHGPHVAVQLGRAETAFRAAVAQAARDAVGDAPSGRLVGAADVAEALVRSDRPSSRNVLAVRNQIVALASRQAVRRARARTLARSDSRSALVVILVGGGLAVLAVLGLVSALLARVRRPLSDLVGTARRLALGDLRARVSVAGPEELQMLGSAFNAMADDLSSALQRVEDERARLELTIQSLGDALLVVAADGTVTAANPRARDLLPELGAGTNVDDADPRLPPLADALTSEVTVERGHSTLAATAALLPGADADESVVWTIRDVTERARLERLKSEFVATASHELRSPLTSIKGFVELLSQTKRLDRKQREFVEIILVSTNRLVDLVNDLLDVARVEAGEIEIHHQPTDIAAVAGEVATLMAPRLEDKQQRLTVEVDVGVPPAFVDPARILQIVTNLMTNAHLYTPVGGELGIRVAADDGKVALVVSDNGRGMSAEQVERVFERFYRGSTGDGIHGSGLGLAIVKSLVELQGGEIEIDTEPGRGTSVTVLLPAEAGGSSQASG